MFALSGIAFSVAWFYLVQSYRQLNSGKFKVIHAIEQNLPLALYEAEWKALGEGRDPKLYRPLTKIEIYAPLTFALIYTLILVLSAYTNLSSLKYYNLQHNAPIFHLLVVCACNYHRPRLVQTDTQGQRNALLAHLNNAGRSRSDGGTGVEATTRDECSLFQSVLTEEINSIVTLFDCPTLEYAQ